MRRRAEAFGDDEEDDCINYTNQLYATQKTTVGTRKHIFKSFLKIPVGTGICYFFRIVCKNIVHTTDGPS